MRVHDILLNDCIPLLLERHAGDAGIDLTCRCSHGPDGAIATDEEHGLVQQIEMFHTTLFDEGRWLQEYMQKHLGRVQTDLNMEECVKVMKPLLVVFAIVEDLEKKEEVTCKFAKLPLARVEHFLDHPDALRKWMTNEDNWYVRESMMNQERRPEAETLHLKPSTSSSRRGTQ